MLSASVSYIEDAKYVNLGEIGMVSKNIIKQHTYHTFIDNAKYKVETFPESKVFFFLLHLMHTYIRSDP